jgi:hypothetical protein
MTALTDREIEAPYIVLIGVLNKEELEKVAKHLETNDIKFASFLDTDFDFGTAAIVTVPISEPTKRDSLRGYQLWKP